MGLYLNTTKKGGERGEGEESDGKKEGQYAFIRNIQDYACKGAE
jgi:hypothetical protein